MLCYAMTRYTKTVHGNLYTIIVSNETLHGMSHRNEQSTHVHFTCVRVGVQACMSSYVHVSMCARDRVCTGVLSMHRKSQRMPSSRTRPLLHRHFRNSAPDSRALPREQGMSSSIGGLLEGRLHGLSQRQSWSRELNPHEHALDGRSPV